MSPLGHEQSLETIKSEILEYEQPRVLDYGAGEGRLIRHLENDSPWAELKGIDRAEFSGSHGEVITGAGLERIEDLGEMDVVAAVNVLQEIEDPELAVQRFRESLGEDGKIVATYPGPMAKPRFEEGILRVDFQDLERLFSDEFKRQPWIGELEPFEQEYIGREQVDRMFQKMDSRESTLPVDVPERTREVLEFLGYEIPPEPEVDYVVAREC
jgi:SAM-dependent methyltransferase